MSSLQELKQTVEDSEQRLAFSMDLLMESLDEAMTLARHVEERISGMRAVVNDTVIPAIGEPDEPDEPKRRGRPAIDGSARGQKPVVFPEGVRVFKAISDAGGPSAYQIASMIGVTPSTAYSWRAGKCVPRGSAWGQVLTLCSVLGVSVDEAP